MFLDFLLLLFFENEVMATIYLKSTKREIFGLACGEKSMLRSEFQFSIQLYKIMQYCSLLKAFLFSDRRRIGIFWDYKFERFLCSQQGNIQLSVAPSLLILFLFDTLVRDLKKIKLKMNPIFHRLENFTSAFCWNFICEY